MAKFFVFVLLSLVLLFFSACKGLGPNARGEAADELIFLTPGDQIVLSNGTKVYVDSEGMLQGSPEGGSILAANRKARDVMMELAEREIFEDYRIVEYGTRSIEVRGAVGHTGKLPYPLHEDWSIMNLLTQLEGIQADTQSRHYLLIRKAWEFPGAYLFIRGEAIPMMEGIGGDDLLLFPGDTILFPGAKDLIYVFGAVKAPLCLTLERNEPFSLSLAIEEAQGFLQTADQQNIEIYRLFHAKKKSILTLPWEKNKDFSLQNWDIVYVPFVAPPFAKQTEEK